MMAVEPSWLQLAVIALLLLAAIYDSVWFRIPNYVVAGILILFAVWSVTSLTLSSFLWHVASGGLVLALGMIMYAGKIWGGGDAKLAFAGALWVPLGVTPSWALKTVLIGGALTAILLLIRHSIPRAKAGAVPELFVRKGPIPYGIAIAISTIAAVVR